MDLDFALGFVGTVTGVISLCITLWAFMQEKPIIKISDVMLLLKKADGDKAIGELSFNIDNAGDRSTTITRVNVIFGDHVEVIEGLRDIQSHSCIRVPEKTDFTIQLVTGIKAIENLRIIVNHTHRRHKLIQKVYPIPQESEWEKRALWKDGPMALEL
jgi:hypothetical protein